PFISEPWGSIRHRVLCNARFMAGLVRINTQVYSLHALFPSPAGAAEPLARAEDVLPGLVAPGAPRPDGARQRAARHAVRVERIAAVLRRVTRPIIPDRVRAFVATLRLLGAVARPIQRRKEA